MSCLKLPRIESYFSRWARVAVLVRSLTATNSMPESPSDERRRLRPMRPKPLMPTLIAIWLLSLENYGFDAEKGLSGRTLRYSLRNQVSREITGSTRSQGLVQDIAKQQRR